MRKRSTPSNTSTGHSTSRNAAAITSVPSEAFGATFFVAKATAKWPMNTLPSLTEHGLLQFGVDRSVTQPDLEQSDVEVLPRNRFSPSRAVGAEPRSRLREKIKRDHGPFLCVPDLVYGGDEGAKLILQRRELGFRAVRTDALLEGVDDLPRREIAQQRHRYASRPSQREHFGCARFPLGQVERADVNLEEKPSADPGAVQLQVGGADPHALLHLDTFDFGSERKPGTEHQQQHALSVHQALS